MKILFIIETLGRGGAERVLVNTLPELQKLGIDCEVAILFKIDDLAKELEDNGIKVHKLELSYKWNIFEGIYKVFTLVKNNRYDIVHAHLFFAYFYVGLSKLFYSNIKTITTFHNLGYATYPANTFLKKIRKKIDTFIIKKFFDKTTAVSLAVQKHYKKHFRLGTIDIIFNSFPIAELEKYECNNSHLALEKYMSSSNDDFIILTPGRLVKEKGHKYLIESAKILNKKYSNFTFLFAGKGPLESHLKKSILPNIKLIGELEHSELMRLYKEVDLIVIPSTHEAFGLVVGEAMIMGKGIVATNVDGIVEMIENEKEGLLVSSKDNQALANSIEKLYQDSELKQTLANNAKEKIKQFDTKVIAKQWKKYYKELLE